MYDTLVAYGQKITKDKLINFVINGLRPKFEPIIAITMTNLASSNEKVCLAYVKFAKV